MRFLSRLDPIITLCIVLLMIVSGVTLLSTTLDDSGKLVIDGIVSKQLGFFAVGTVLFLIVSNIDISYLKFPAVASVIYVGTLLLLLLVLVAGPVINNVQRWIFIGGIQLQPSEFAKITLIIVTAAIFYAWDELDDLLKGVISFLSLLPMAVLIYLEPHGSMTLMSTLIWFLLVMTFMRDQLRNFLLLGIVGSIALGILIAFLGSLIIGIPFILFGFVLFLMGVNLRESKRIFYTAALLIGIAGGIFGIVAWDNVLEDYQKERIEAFRNPEELSEDEAFNVNQSKIAIGSAGLWGKGFGYGTQSRLNFLPEHQTDFIFATYAEQFGYVGSVVLMGIYALLIFRILTVGMKNGGDRYLSMIVVGVGIKLMIEVFINIGTNVGVIPATGIPLPLVSAGGSSILATMVALGMVQSALSAYSSSDFTTSTVDNDDLLL